MFFMRSMYYKMIKRISDVEQIEHFYGFGLYDRSFVKVLADLEDPAPFLRGIVAELGFERKEIHFAQAKRRAGKTSNNWYKLYDAGMLGITSYSKVIMRIATMVGFVFSVFSLVIAISYFIMKLMFWNSLPIGTATDHHRYLLTGVDSDILYRTVGRICTEHQRSCNETPVGCRGRKTEFLNSFLCQRIFN